MNLQVFETEPPQSTSNNNYAFGFMMCDNWGTLLRVDAHPPSSGHFIHRQMITTDKVVLYMSSYFEGTPELFMTANLTVFVELVLLQDFDFH